MNQKGAFTSYCNPVDQLILYERRLAFRDL